MGHSRWKYMDRRRLNCWFWDIVTRMMPTLATNSVCLFKNYTHKRKEVHRLREFKFNPPPPHDLQIAPKVTHSYIRALFNSISLNVPTEALNYLSVPAEPIIFDRKCLIVYLIFVNFGCMHVIHVSYSFQLFNQFHI